MYNKKLIFESVAVVSHLYCSIIMTADRPVPAAIFFS